MTGLYATLIGVGCALLLLAAVWWLRSRHTRKLWRSTSHDANRVAIVLELEEKVRELEARTVERRELDMTGRR